MARIYANLVKKGLKTLNNIPDKLKAEVQAIIKNDNYFIV